MIGIMTQRNSIKMGYPVVEAILSYLPVCDYYIVNDGGSDDSTIDVLHKLTDVYGNIEITHMKDYPSERWNCVTEQLNTLIKEHVPEDEWVFLGNADEVIDHKDIPKFKEIHERHDILAYRFPRLEITPAWTINYDLEQAYKPARSALNVNNLYMKWESYGGDEWLDDNGWRRYPDDGCKYVPIVAWHMYAAFPQNMYEKRKNDATFIAQGDSHRVSIFEKFDKDRIPKYRPKPIPEQIPKIVQHHAFKDNYEVAEFLFDPDELNKVLDTDLY